MEKGEAGEQPGEGKRAGRVVPWHAAWREDTRLAQALYAGQEIEATTPASISSGIEA